MSSLRGNLTFHRQTHKEVKRHTPEKSYVHEKTPGTTADAGRRRTEA